MSRTIQEEVDRNYEAFERKLPELLMQQNGKFALMRDGECLGFYSSAADARAAGDLAFKDGLFSIQHVTNRPVDLGFYTHAVLSIHV